jgi:type VI protein secretion system component VasK
VPALFIASMALLMLTTLIERPAESVLGLAAIALGWPAYAWWRWRGRRAEADAASADAAAERTRSE